MSIRFRKEESVFTRVIQSACMVAVCFASSLAIPSGEVFAQSTATLEEIIVTSRRYAEDINDAPLSVNVLDGEYLKSSGVNNVSDIVELTPGATWGHYTMAQPGFTLRGIESYNVGNASLESGVQMVIDGVPITKAFMMSPQIYDLDRVEVMRGPQGTTFGRNATLGLVHFISGQPTQDFSAAANFSAGTRGLLGINGHINGGVSDTVAIRVAANWKEYEGELEDENTGQSLEGSRGGAIRASASFTPSDTFSALLKLEHVVDRNDPSVRRHESCTVPVLLSPPYINEYTPPCDNWKASVSSPPPGGWYENRDMSFLTGELVWDLGDVAITSLTGLQKGQHETIMDVFASPEVIQDQIVENEANVFSTELRVDNAASGKPITWLVGLYLLDQSEDRLEHNIGAPPRGNGAGRINPLA